MMGGAMPIVRNQSPLADWTQTTRAIGRPQKISDKPRTNLPNEPSNSACAGESGGCGPGSRTGGGPDCSGGGVSTFTWGIPSEPSSRMRSCHLRSPFRPRSEAQVSVAFQAPFVFVQEAHGFAGFDAVRLDGFVHLRLHPPFQFVFVVLHGGQGLADGGALDDLLDVIPGGFVRLEEDVDLVDASEKIVQVAHDVLIGAHEENA